MLPTVVSGTPGTWVEATTVGPKVAGAGRGGQGRAEAAEQAEGQDRHADPGEQRLGVHL